MDRIFELVQQLEPETAAPSVDARARQRDALLRSIAQVDKARTRPRWRPRHKGWLVAIAGLAAVFAVLATMLVPRLSSSTHQPGASPATPAVLTAITRALANTGSYIEEVHSTASASTIQVSSTSWVNLATGACRTDTAINGQPSLTVFVEHGTAVIIDYGRKQWWTRATGGVTCEPLTPQAIEHDLASGQFTVSGRTTVDGEEALKLETMTTTTGLHPVTKLTTLWVNATSYLPIQATSNGHGTEQTAFHWLPATAANMAVLKITVPDGFRKLATPPPAGTG